MTVLSKEKIKLQVKVADKYEAIRLVGQLLVDAGHVSEAYVDAMIERENMLSTYMGSGLAIPHGTNEAKSLVRSTGLAVITVPEGVVFDQDQKATLIVGIAASGDEHIELLTNIASIVSDEDTAAQILASSSEEEVLRIFQGGN